MAMFEGASKSYFLHSPAVEGDNPPSNGTITFNPSVLQQPIIIPSVYLKLSRTFTVLLTGAPTRVTLSPSHATVTITENNGRWDIVVVCMLSKQFFIIDENVLDNVDKKHVTDNKGA